MVHFLALVMFCSLQAHVLLYAPYLGCFVQTVLDTHDQIRPYEIMFYESTLSFRQATQCMSG